MCIKKVIKFSKADDFSHLSLIILPLPPGSLLSSISARHQRVSDEIHSLDGVDRTAAELSDRLRRLQREVDRADPWDRDAKQAEETLKVRVDFFLLRNKVSLGLMGPPPLSLPPLFSHLAFSAISMQIPPFPPHNTHHHPFPKHKYIVDSSLISPNENYNFFRRDFFRAGSSFFLHIFPSFPWNEAASH